MNGLTTDIESGDLLIEDGSAVLSESEGQTAETVLVAMRGKGKACGASLHHTPTCTKNMNGTLVVFQLVSDIFKFLL